MCGNANDVPDEEKHKIDEISLEIQKLLKSTKEPATLSRKETLSPKLKELITLGSAIATNQERLVEPCMSECLRLGATREQIEEVLNMAILMSEVPAEAYDTIVREAIDDFKDRN
jgi:alkylhydroperoxidase/carboxymuconolactone decarboxylase family protein YurZ